YLSVFLVTGAVSAGARREVVLDVDGDLLVLKSSRLDGDRARRARDDVEVVGAVEHLLAALVDLERDAVLVHQQNRERRRDDAGIRRQRQARVLGLGDDIAGVGGGRGDRRVRRVRRDRRVLRGRDDRGVGRVLRDDRVVGLLVALLAVADDDERGDAAADRE